MRIQLIFASICLVLGCGQEKTPTAEPDNRPNILIILADDLGYSDLGCYGSEINTPNIDALASNGILFTQFYNSARCCPSRASLLTGLYPHQAGIGSFAGNDKGRPGYRGRLNDNSVTIAEALKAAGYRTFGSGKWHVNLPGPINRGFEEFYGFLEDYGVDGWEQKWMKRYPEGRAERNYSDGSFFATNAITDYALDFLDTARNTPDQPWFMYLAYQAPHFPLQAPQEDIDKYKDTYHVGWDTIRARRYHKMLELGVIESSSQLSPRSEFVIQEVGERNKVPGDGKHNPAWSKLSRDRRADLARRMAVYAGMVDNMDQNIGRVISNLKAKGELENTLIFFLSDNGACGEWDSYGFEYPDHDARVAGGTPGHPNILHKEADLEKLGGPDGPLFSYGSGWANVGNTPFTLYKMFTHEGGISSPLIMHWPARIAGDSIFSDRYAHVMDIMATCLEVADTAYPLYIRNQNTVPMEGKSLFNTLAKEVPSKRLLIFEHAGHPAIREGNWKLVSRDDAMQPMTLNPGATFELYNVGRDRSESKEMSAVHPDLVTQLKIKMINEFRRVKVLPRPR